MSTTLIGREELGRRISSLRGYLQLSQSDFGKPARAGRNTIGAWERGSTSAPIDQLDALCQHWFGRGALELLSPDWDSRVWSKRESKRAAA